MNKSTSTGSRIQLLILSLARTGVIASAALAIAMLFAKHHWILDLIANLRIQVVAAMALAFVVALAAGRKRLVAVALASLMLQVVPFSIAYRRPPVPTEHQDSLTLMTLNVLTSNTNTDGIINSIRDSNAGFIALLEVNAWQCERLLPELENEYPFRHLELDEHGNFGMAILSREPFSDLRVFQATPSLDSIEATWNGLRVIATHPPPPIGASRFHARNRHLQAVASRVRELSIQTPDVPVVVVGDFNLTPWSPWMRDFEIASGLQRVAKGFGITPTWYARPNQYIFGLVLDHVFISDRLSVNDYRVGQDVGSDHRGVIVQLHSAPLD